MHHIKKSVLKVLTYVKNKLYTYNNKENLEFLVELPLEDTKFVSLPDQDQKIWELWDKVKGWNVK